MRPARAGRGDRQVGKRLARAQALYTTPGFADEEVTLFEATGREDVERDPNPEERIEIVRWPLADLQLAIDGCFDASSLIGLLMLQGMLR